MKFLRIWVLLQSESPWQRNDASTFFIYLCVSLYREVFFKKSLKGVCTCHNWGKYGKVWTNSVRAFSRYFAFISYNKVCSLGFSNEYFFYTKINSALPTYILRQRLNSSRRLRATCIVHLTCLLSFPSVDKCADCDINADCVNGKCRCKMGYVGTGYACVKGNLAATNWRWWTREFIVQAGHVSVQTLL